jgi:c-di-GMP-binding flagellar brake protein YcgR
MIKEKKVLKERRKAPRIKCDFNIEIESQKSDVSGHALNISTSGMYLECDNHIPLFREIRVGIKLPGVDDIIECTGVVVRSDKDPKKDCYDVAIFFEDIEPEDKEKLAECIDRKMKG